MLHCRTRRRCHASDTECVGRPEVINTVLRVRLSGIKKVVGERKEKPLKVLVPKLIIPIQCSDIHEMQYGETP